MQEVQVAIRYHNIHTSTVNEIRAKVGKDPLPGGDRLFAVTPVGIVFLDEVEKVSTKYVNWNVP
tara:strand:+ start:1083 stop:1274 length:192 start_codon:yes stop_codon:yes gene_type:complete